MESISLRPANVVRFTGGRRAASPRREQGDFLDAVYAAGSLAVAAEDRVAKVMAARLTIFGFVMIDEVLSDGSARRLRPSEAVHTCMARPWRVSKLASTGARGPRRA